MRLIVAAAIFIVFGGIFLASMLTQNQKLSAAELASMKSACPSCHGRVPSYDQAITVHDKHAALHCSRCHDSKPDSSQTGSGAKPVPSATATPASQSVPTASPVEGPPSIPHTLEGRGSCLSCHGSSGGPAPQVPVDHAGRTNDMCTSCHVQSK